VIKGTRRGTMESLQATLAEVLGMGSLRQVRLQHALHAACSTDAYRAQTLEAAEVCILRPCFDMLLSVAIA
jgi:hypothetical protein